MFRPAHCFLDLLCSQKRERIKYSFLFFFLCTYYQSLQSCPTLCDPMDCSPPGSSVHGILQARILEWVVMPFSRGSSQPRDRTRVSCTAGREAPSVLLWAFEILNMVLECRRNLGFIHQTKLSFHKSAQQLLYLRKLVSNCNNPLLDDNMILKRDYILLIQGLS